MKGKIAEEEIVVIARSFAVVVFLFCFHKELSNSLQHTYWYVCTYTKNEQNIHMQTHVADYILMKAYGLTLLTLHFLSITNLLYS